jgi:hypothetical protein
MLHEPDKFGDHRFVLGRARVLARDAEVGGGE